MSVSTWLKLVATNSDIEKLLLRFIVVSIIKISIIEDTSLFSWLNATVRVSESPNMLDGKS